jgi:heme/copper-type cytochrome/quinol oxidase subunit 1
MKPGVWFLSEASWLFLLPIHVWATTLALLILVLSTLSHLGEKSTIGHWGIWIGASCAPLLVGGIIHVTLLNSGPESYLSDTIYRTAYQHAYGTTALLIGLGGLSAHHKVKTGHLPFKFSLGFALPMGAAGLALTFSQAVSGLSGMPRRYIDYPQEFAPLQFLSSVVAILCSALAAVYIVLLWRLSKRKTNEIESIF